MINKHIFSLVENPNDLPSSNENMADMFYREVIPTRNIQDIGTAGTYSSKFAGSAISLRWMLDNRTWWIPSRSYLSLQLEITKPDGTKIQEQDQIAPNMGIAPSLFNRLHFKMNDVSVAHISEYISQCDAMGKRVYQTSHWMGKNIGQDVGFWSPHFKRRQADLTKTDVVADEIIVEEYDGFIKLTREELGFGQSEEKQSSYVNFLIDNTTNTFSYTSVGGAFLPNANEVFKNGDLMFFKPQNNVRYFVYMLGIRTGGNNNGGYVRGITGAAFVLGQDTSISGPGWKMFVLRHKCDICSSTSVSTYLVNDLSNVTRAITAADSTIEFGGLGLTSITCLCPGDFAFTQPVNGGAGSLRNGGIITNQIQATELVLGLSQGVWEAGDQVAVANNTEVVKTGYCVASLKDWSNVNVACTLEALTNIVTVTFLNQTFSKIWDVLQPGDYIGINYLAAGETIWGFVQDIIDATHFHLCISRSWVANLGDGTQDNGFLFAIYRYVPCCKAVYVDKAKNANKFDINWKPSCLSIFNYPGAIPGGCKFEFEIQGNNQFYTGLAIETPPGIVKVPRNTASTVGFDYQLLVKSVKFYVCTVTGPAIGDDQYSYYLNLNEIRAHTRTLNTTSTTQTAIDVTPSSYALALAFQDKRAEVSARTDYSISKFHVGLKDELYLKRYSIRFAGLSLPQPDADIQYNPNNLDEFWGKVYIRNQFYLNQYYKTTGGENFNDWKERGLFLYHPFIRSAGNKEGRVYVITQFENETQLRPGFSTTSTENMNLFLFEFYRSFAYIRMSKGNVFEVRTAIQ